MEWLQLAFIWVTYLLGYNRQTIQVYTDTLCATQRESNLTTITLKDIPTFDVQDSSLLEDWFMDIEPALTS